MIELKEGFVLKKGVFIVEEREEGDESVYSRVDKEGVHQTVKVTTDYTGVLCKKERQEEKNNTRLLISQ